MWQVNRIKLIISFSHLDLKNDFPFHSSFCLDLLGGWEHLVQKGSRSGPAETQQKPVGSLRGTPGVT